MPPRLSDDINTQLITSPSSDFSSWGDVVHDIGRSIYQGSQSLYYSYYLRTALAFIFIFGKIFQAAGQNVIGLDASEDKVPGILPSEAMAMTVVLTLINILVNASTRATNIYDFFLPSKMFIVDKLPLPKGVDFSNSYIISLEGQGSLHKMGKNGCQSVALNDVGKQAFHDFCQALNDEFASEDNDTYFRDGKNYRQINGELSAQHLSIFSKVESNIESKPYESNLVALAFAAIYSVCWLSMPFSCLSAYLSALTLVEKFLSVAIAYEIEIGLGVAFCAGVAYSNFNLPKMHDGVSALCRTLDEGMSQDYSLREISSPLSALDLSTSPALEVKRTKGKLYFKIDADGSALTYITENMKGFARITRDELSAKLTEPGLINSAVGAEDIETGPVPLTEDYLNQPENKVALLKIVQEGGNTCLKGYDIPQKALWIAVVVTLCGILSGAGMSYLVTSKSVERIPGAKNLSFEEQEMIVFTSVFTSIFTSIFAFAYSSYELLKKKYPVERDAPSLIVMLTDPRVGTYQRHNDAYIVYQPDPNQPAKGLYYADTRGREAKFIDFSEQLTDFLTTKVYLSLYDADGVYTAVDHLNPEQISQIVDAVGPLSKVRTHPWYAKAIVGTDSASNSLGSLIGMLLIYAVYLKSENTALNNFYLFMIAYGFIGNLAMNFSMGLNGTDKAINIINNSVERLKACGQESIDNDERNTMTTNGFSLSGQTPEVANSADFVSGNVRFNLGERPDVIEKTWRQWCCCTAVTRPLESQSHLGQVITRTGSEIFDPYRDFDRATI